MMKLFAPGLWAICLDMSFGQVTQWKQFTNGDEITSQAIHGQTAWVRTTGGLVKLDLATGPPRFSTLPIRV